MDKPRTNFEIFELDELFGFIRFKSKTKTRENVYVCLMISRSPRQIVGMFADKTKTAELFEEMVNRVPAANRYCTDGNLTYLDVVFPGIHRCNDRDKGETQC